MNKRGQRGFAIAMVLLALFFVGLITYLMSGGVDPRSAKSSDMQKTAGEIVSGIQTIHDRIETLVKPASCWPNGGLCKDGMVNSAGVPDGTLVKQASYPYAADNNNNCQTLKPDANTCHGAGNPCGYAWGAQLCYRAANGEAKKLWDFRGDPWPTVNDADLFISANGKNQIPNSATPFALGSGTVDIMPPALPSNLVSALNVTGMQNQDIFQLRNSAPTSGVYPGGFYLRILPADPADPYTKQVLDLAASQLTNRPALGLAKVQRCGNSGPNPGALMVSFYSSNSLTLCP